jgi:hypothetical protein
MNHRFKLAIGGAVLMAAALIPTVTHADEFDKKTVLTFSGPVQVPGMTLDAGKYVFKLLDSSSDRFIVQIFNDSEQHLYTTLLAIPNLHLTTPDKTVITFYEAPSGQPQPLKAWFYPGDNYGRQFVYPKSEAQQIAAAAHETVPSETTYGTASAPVSASVQTSTDTSNAQVNQPVTTDSTITTDQSTQAPVEPENQQPAVADETASAAPEPPAAPATVDAAPAVTEPTTEPDQTPAPAPDTTAPSTDNSALPATASNLPLIAFLGLLSILGAIALRFASRLS